MDEQAGPSRKTPSRRRRQGWQTETLSENLRKARDARGLTQAEIAAKFGVDPRTYGRWERGEYMPIIDDVARLARILGVSITQLLGAPSELTPDEDQLLAALLIYRMQRVFLSLRMG